ncbi:MAG: M48 family metalloprotease [Gammaproteobacteria bacterium]|jgi:heat shock protein HtpX|nr:M48 family metalloprotease [Gammaproteobacteria bacterium]
MLGFKVSPTTETNIKSLLVMTGFLTIVGALGSLAAGTSGVLFGIGLTVATSATVLWLSREIALWLFKAKEVKPGEKPEGFDLVAMVDNLRQLEKVNLSTMPKVCVMESKTKNAFATGRNQNHTAIAITTGLLKEAKAYAKGDMVKANRWIEAILLHELGHIVNRDITTKTAASILIGSIRVLSESLYQQKKRERTAHKKSKKDEPSFISKTGEYLLYHWIVPYTGTLLGLCLSRTREFAADDMAATCGRATDLAEAFELLRKPGKNGLHDHDHAHDHDNHMEAFSSMMCASLHPEIDQKLADRAKKSDVGMIESFSLGVNNLFSTHPPLEARIARMREQAKDKHVVNDTPRTILTIH